jgi:hypothetical protein
MVTLLPAGATSMIKPFCLLGSAAGGVLFVAHTAGRGISKINFLGAGGEDAYWMDEPAV